MSGQAQGNPPNELWISVLWKRCRSELLARPLFYLVTFVTIVMLVGLFYWPIRVTKYGKLTDLELILFQLFLVALPAAISWALAKRKEEQNVLAKQKALARSAVRRISSIGAAAGRLADVIELRKTAVTSAPQWSEMDTTRKALLYELFDGLSKQVVEIRDNIEASEGDWRDILPEEFAKKEAVEREILRERELAIEEREKTYKELQVALEKGEARTAEQIAALKEAVARQIATVGERLSVKVEQIKSQPPFNVSPFSISPGNLTPFLGPSTLAPDKITFVDLTPFSSPNIAVAAPEAHGIFGPGQTEPKVESAAETPLPHRAFPSRRSTQAAKAETVAAAKAHKEEAKPNPEPEKKD